LTGSSQVGRPYLDNFTYRGANDNLLESYKIHHKLSDVYGDDNNSESTAPPSIGLSDFSQPYDDGYGSHKRKHVIVISTYIYFLLLALVLGMIVNMYQMLSGYHTNDADMSIRLLFWPFLFFLGVVFASFVMRYEITRLQIAGYIQFLQQVNWFWRGPFFLHSWNYAIVAVLFTCTTDDADSALPFLSLQTKESIIVMIWCVTHAVETVCWLMLAKIISHHNKTRPYPDSTLSTHLASDVDLTNPKGVIQQQEEMLRLLEKQVESTKKEIERLEQKRTEEAASEENRLRETIEEKQEEILRLERGKERLQQEMDDLDCQLAEKSSRLQKMTASLVATKGIIARQSSEIEEAKHAIRKLEADNQKLDRMKKVEDEEVARMKQEIEKEGAALIGTSYHSTSELLSEPLYDPSFYDETSEILESEHASEIDATSLFQEELLFNEDEESVKYVDIKSTTSTDIIRRKGSIAEETASIMSDDVLEQNSDDSDESDDEIILGDEEQTGV